MNFYDSFKTVLDYIEQHLDDEIDQQELAHISGINYATLQRVFPFVTGATLAEYIRNRRLTLAGKDLVQTDLRIVDVALKYGYDSAASFSRAFKKFHHLKPSTAKKHVGRLRHFAKAQLTLPPSPRTIAYEVIERPQITLYGLEVLSDIRHIKQDAPQLFEHIRRCYPELPHPDYGLLDYAMGRNDERGYHYYVLWRERHRDNFLTKQVPAGRWLKFHIPSHQSRAIQDVSDRFYSDFLPTCEYRLRPDPELEHYHEHSVDFLVPIY